METSFISAQGITRSPVALGDTLTEVLATQTRFSDLPLPARVLLAVTRVRSSAGTLTLAERYVLDTLGRTIDAGPHRAETISAVSRFAESLIKPNPLTVLNTGTMNNRDKQWLTSVENFALCVLCQIRADRGEEARQLLSQWLGEGSIEQFNTAATVLCKTECFKRGGPHVFSPAWSDSKETAEKRAIVPMGPATHTADLSLNESIVLNAIRLRSRTLGFPNIATKVLPLLTEHLALPRLEAIIDSYVFETLRHCELKSAINCTCCGVISPIEARLLSGVAEHSSGDTQSLECSLQSWMDEPSVSQLVKSHERFQTILQELKFTVPLRQWNWSELKASGKNKHRCTHTQEPSMVA
ncbi:MAG: hypothetical protein AB8B63_06440 [Granulosicoccus sp.]